MRLFAVWLTTLALSQILAVSAPTATLSGDPKTSRTRRMEFARLQILLASSGFSPGTIDGLPGKKTIQAKKYFIQSGLPLDLPDPAWKSWRVPNGFLKDIGINAKTWTDRSKSKSLTFESAAEKISEEFQLSRSFLELLNPQIKNWSQIKEGTPLNVPNLHLLNLVPADRIIVKLKDHIMIAMDPLDNPMASFPCSIATQTEKRPVGELKVVNLASNPIYVFDPTLYPDASKRENITSKLIIPPGPNNPVGRMWIGLNLKGYGIHGTPNPESIGRSESHGCFRLTNWDAIRLSTIVDINTPVIVTE